MPTPRLLLILGILLLGGGAVISLALFAPDDETGTVVASELDPTTTTTTTASFSESVPGLDELQAGRLEAARAEIREHLAQDPNDEEAGYLLAVTYERSGEIEEAIGAYEGILRRHPAHYEAAFHIGRLYEELGQPAQGAEAYQRALEINADFAGARIALARVLAPAGELEEAADLLFDTIDRRPMGVHLDEVRVELARILEDLGQRDNAVLQLQRALLDNPDNQTAQELLEELSGGLSPGTTPTPTAPSSFEAPGATTEGNESSTGGPPVPPDAGPQPPTQPSTTAT